jgi:hypothetical protein
MKKLIKYVRSKPLHILELLLHVALFGLLKQGTHLLYNTMNFINGGQNLQLTLGIPMPHHFTLPSLPEIVCF